MRGALTLLSLASPAAAWKFTPVPVCTLTHTTGDTTLTVTCDPRAPQPSTLAATGGWPAAPAFPITFAGPRGLTISTARHTVSGGTLTVADTGFGNVRDGLEFNDSATLTAGPRSVTLPLEGAAAPLRIGRRNGTG